MKDNTSLLILAAILCLFSFGAGWMAGSHHERNHRSHFNFRYDRDRGVIINGSGNHRDGRVSVWPFVDVEYERQK